MIVAVVRNQVERGEVVRASGTLEVLPDGYGFLLSAARAAEKAAAAAAKKGSD